jgi:predicted metal-dependent peptidase
MEQPVQPLEDFQSLDVRELNRLLDITRSRIYLGKNSAFFGSMLCGMNFFWTTGIQTACTNGEFYAWNPQWFLELDVECRPTVLMHEVWHPARMHMQRRGDRDPYQWNVACDIVINNNLERDGYSFKGFENCWKDQSLFGKTEEEIYEIVPLLGGLAPGSWGNAEDGGDMQECPTPQKTVNNIIRSIHAAEQAGEAGTLPGEVTETVNAYLNPAVPWERHIQKFLTELCHIKYKWTRPNRRYTNMYLPHRAKDKGKLAHIDVYIDVSGSISRSQIQRILSELVYLKEQYKPDKMTFSQFDTRITHTEVIDRNTDISEYEIHGGGGTSLVPVHARIEDTKPTGVIIFSDMHVPEMQPLSYEVPLIWVVLDNPTATVPFGTKVHVKSSSIQ